MLPHKRRSAAAQAFEADRVDQVLEHKTDRERLELFASSGVTLSVLVSTGSHRPGSWRHSTPEESAPTLTPIPTFSPGSFAESSDVSSISFRTPNASSTKPTASPRRPTAHASAKRSMHRRPSPEPALSGRRRGRTKRAGNGRRTSPPCVQSLSSALKSPHLPTHPETRIPHADAEEKRRPRRQASA
jgi:hypothetical protein